MTVGSVLAGLGPGEWAVFGLAVWAVLGYLYVPGFPNVETRLGAALLILAGGPVVWLFALAYYLTHERKG